MSSLFDDRERAAEYGFTHAEELRFLAAREGVQALADWAAARMHHADAAAYATILLDTLLGGASDEEIVARVRSDLDRAGQPDAANEVSVVLAQAFAQAHAKLYEGEQARRSAVASQPPVGPQSHHRHGFWGWNV